MPIPSTASVKRSAPSIFAEKARTRYVRSSSESSQHRRKLHSRNDRYEADKMGSTQSGIQMNPIWLLFPQSAGIHLEELYRGDDRRQSPRPPLSAVQQSTFCR